MPDCSRATRTCSPFSDVTRLGPADGAGSLTSNELAAVETQSGLEHPPALGTHILGLTELTSGFGIDPLYRVTTTRAITARALDHLSHQSRDVFRWRDGRWPRRRSPFTTPPAASRSGSSAATAIRRPVRFAPRAASRYAPAAWSSRHRGHSRPVDRLASNTHLHRPRP